MAFVLIILIAIVLASTAKSGSDQPTPPPLASASPTDAPTAPSAAPTTAPTRPATTVTADYAGSWAGIGYQTSPRTTHWEVRITLVAGRRYGTVRYPQCAGVLRVESSSVEELVLHQTITTGRRKCAATGYVTLSKPGATSMRYAYADVADAQSPDATGTLYKR